MNTIGKWNDIVLKCNLLTIEQLKITHIESFKKIFSTSLFEFSPFKYRDAENFVTQQLQSKKEGIFFHGSL